MPFQESGFDRGFFEVFHDLDDVVGGGILCRGASIRPRSSPPHLHIIQRPLRDAEDVEKDR